MKITLVSAAPGDAVPGVELSDPDCPITWPELPKPAQKWASSQGYGPDNPDELLYVLSQEDSVPSGFKSFRFTRRARGMTL